MSAADRGRGQAVREFTLRTARGTPLVLGGKTLVMGVLNVTPDSFSDGGLWTNPEEAVRHGIELVAQGADILDVGAESTRPGAAPVPEGEERDRLLPVVRGLRARVETPISIDTAKADVFDAACAEGGDILNDVTALSGDPRMGETAARHGAPVVLMHMQGTPRTMQAAPRYGDVVADVCAYLADRIAAAGAAGVPVGQTVVDPGIGFGKTLAHNLELLRRLGEFERLGRPVLVGTSRKSFLGAVLGVPPAERLFGTAASVAVAVAAGAAVVRVHDVAEMRQVVDVCDAIGGRWACGIS